MLIGMSDGFIQGIFEKSAVRTYSDSRRVYLRDVPGLGDVPLGRKLQLPGPRCRPWRHAFVEDVYPGVRHEYVDKVCTKCDRRKMVK